MGGVERGGWRGVGRRNGQIRGLGGWEEWREGGWGGWVLLCFEEEVVNGIDVDV